MGQFVKPVVKPFWKNGNFRQLKKNISAAKEEVDEEIQLASEEKIQRIPQLQMEFKNAQTQRSEQSQEIEESRVFCSQQTFALANTEELQIQRIIKAEGMSELGIVTSQA